MIRTGRIAVGAVVVALVAAACSTTPTTQKGGSAVAFLTTPETMDPARCFNVNCFEALNRIFDSLLSYDPQTAEAKTDGAAAAFKVSDDARTITYTLREGATFHNGEPVNAAAFIRGLSRAAAKETASEVAFQLGGIVGFSDVQEGKKDTLAGVRQGNGELELVIELDSPDPEFALRTGHTVFSPVPQAAIDNPEGFGSQPVGNGPYALTKPWKGSGDIAVDRFKNYKGPVPGSLDSITWRTFENLDTALRAFQGGSLDVTEVPRERIASAPKDFGKAFVSGSTAELVFMFANTEVDETDDPELRKAVSMAFDRQAIIDAVFKGAQVPATSIVPPATAGHRPNVCAYCVFDVEKARTALAAAGGAPADPLVLTYFSGSGHGDWAAAVKAQVEENLPGVKIKLEGVATGPKYGATVTGKAPRFGPGFGVQGWVQDFPTLGNWIYDLFHSKADGSLARYSNAKLDALLDEAKTALDPATRLRKYQEGEDMVLADMPIVPMWYPRTGLLYDTKAFGSFPIDVQTGQPAWERVTAA